MNSYSNESPIMRKCTVWIINSCKPTTNTFDKLKSALKIIKFTLILIQIRIKSLSIQNIIYNRIDPIFFQSDELTKQSASGRFEYWHFPKWKGLMVEFHFRWILLRIFHELILNMRWFCRRRCFFRHSNYFQNESSDVNPVLEAFRYLKI